MIAGFKASKKILIKALSTVLVVITSSVATYCQTLHLYGGNNHDEYLGCLNCDKFDVNSIWNQFGTYGNRFATNSIWNKFGTYGNKFNNESPWNKFGTKPPVVVDKDGNFYGYLSLNKYTNKRADFSLALTLYENYELIREDVAKYYEIIFE